jgi:oligoendopeptidase F
MIDLTIPKKKRHFVPDTLEIRWESLEPLFNDLLERDITSVQELENWLKDKSELEAALEEDFAWRYIRMSCDTTNESLLNDFQYFATEIEPKISPIANRLNLKFNGSPFIDELDQDKYFVFIRGIRKAIEIYRDENVELLTKLQVTQQKYQSVTGRMSVVINDQEYTLEQAANFIKDTNRELREQAWKTIQQRRLVDKDELNILFDELVAMRHQVAINAGFENFRDYMFPALGRFDYTPQDCYQFHEAIEKEVVPILKEQADKRAELLGIDSLKPWDTEVSTTGKPALKPFKDGQDLIDKSINCFDAIDPKLGQMLSMWKAEREKRQADITIRLLKPVHRSFS